MLRRLSTKISVSIAGVLSLALLSSAAALASAWKMGRLMVDVMHDNLPSLRAADELEVALLEQRGLVSSCILDDGNPKWIEELASRKPAFDECYAAARRTALTPEEFDVLDDLFKAYQGYDNKRNEVVQLVEKERAEAAREMLFREVLPLHKEADRLSKKFKATNLRFIDEATQKVAARVRQDTLLVAACVLLTLGAGTFLFVQFIRGFVRPVRRILAEARGFTQESPVKPPTLSEDELHEVRSYLRSLMNNVTDARTTLEKNRIELRNVEKLASVGKLASSVAHEIRNPLTALKMWLFWIREEVAAKPQVNEAFDVVAAEVTRLEQIVRNFLEFTRPPELKLQNCDLRETIELTLQLMSPRLSAAGIELLQHCDDCLPLVLADAQQMKQVFINLFDNAVQELPDGGAIEISAGTQMDRCGVRSVVIRIHDSGPGIPADVAGRIFEPFFSTKGNGTGLGLCIAASIMARHGGRLSLEPSLKGACFSVSLPVTTAEISSPHDEVHYALCHQ